MNAEMAGKAVQPVTGLVDEVGGEAGRQLHSFPNRLRAPGVEILREPVDLRLGQTERLADVLVDRDPMFSRRTIRKR